MPRLKLTIGYDGTGYHGWQKQPSLKTIQGQFEETLLRLTQQTTRIYGAGRTDSGVHALAQVAHFESPLLFLPEEWMRALNALLPEDIVVNAVETVDASFHARFLAREKQYRYQILNARCRFPLERQTRWLVRYDLDLQQMVLAAKALTGAHLFTSFCSTATEATNHAIDLKQVQIKQQGERLDIIFRAPRFLQHMVRNLVGFLVEVGRGRRYPDEVPTIFEAKDRTKAGPAAPPHGLFLVKVYY